MRRTLRQRRRPRDRAAERAGRRRADRPAAGPQRPGVSIHDDHARPADRRRAIRRHDPQDPIADGRIVRLHDVARIELGALAYDQICTLDGQPSVALSIYQLPGSNALETARNVRNKMDELQGRFPEGRRLRDRLRHHAVYHESVNEVFKSLRDAVILVAIVVLVFLQGWRAAIIPLVAVPVAIVGTFAAMAGVGFSLNTLTLFGLVLAIGIVVDDAIVVVEAIEHHIEHGMTPRDAAMQAMDEVAGPVIAVGLVLTACLFRASFITGIVGQFFRQFAVTIAISTLISAFNSLTLSPALAVLLLKPRQAGHHEPLPRLAFLARRRLAGYCLGGRLAGAVAVGSRHRRSRRSLARHGSAPAWDWLIGVARGPLVQPAAGVVLRRRSTACSISRRTATSARSAAAANQSAGAGRYGGLLYADLRICSTPRRPVLFQRRTRAICSSTCGCPIRRRWTHQRSDARRSKTLAGKMPGVQHTVAIAGQSMLFGANAPNFGSMYVMLDEFHDRAHRRRYGRRIAAKLQDSSRRRNSRRRGQYPRRSAGRRPGHRRRVQIVIEDRGDNGLDALQQVSRQIVMKAQRTPGLRGAVHQFPRRHALAVSRHRPRRREIDGRVDGRSLRHAAGQFRLAVRQRLQPLWPHLAGERAGRRRYRMQVDDLKRLKVRNDQGQMVPFAAIATPHEVTGPVMLDALQPVSVGARSTPTPRRARVPARRSSGCERRRRRICCRPCGPNGPNWRYLQLAGGQHGHVRVPAGRGAGVPGAGRAVRKLGAAAGGDSGRADVPALFDRRRDHGRDGYQYLHADRLRRAGRPGLQERDSDRRVRPDRGTRPGPTAARRRWTPAGCGCGRSS